MWGIFLPETINFLPALLNCLGSSIWCHIPHSEGCTACSPCLCQAVQGDHSTAKNPALIITTKLNHLPTGKIHFFCLKIVSTYNLRCNIKPLSSHTSPTGHLISAAKSCPGRGTEAPADRNAGPDWGREATPALIRPSRGKPEPQGFSGVTEALQLDERAGS